MRLSWLLEDLDDCGFRTALDDARVADSAYDLPAIAEEVSQLAEEHGRFIEAVVYSSRTDERMLKLNCFAYAFGLNRTETYWG